MRGPVADLFLDPIDVYESGGIGGAALVRHEVRTLHRRTEQVPVMRLYRRDCDASVFGWEEVERIQRHGALQPCGVRLAGEAVLRHRTLLEGQHRVVHRNVQELSFARMLSVVDRRDDAKRHQRARENVGKCRRH